MTFHKTPLAAALCAAMLTACGGSDNDTPDDSAQALAWRAGDVIEVSNESSDSAPALQRFKLYGVSAEGELQAAPSPSLIEGALLPLPDDGDAAVPLRAFYKALWDAAAARLPGAAPHEILQEVTDLDAGVGTLYANFQHSGMDLPAYLAFFAPLDQVPFFADQATAEDELIAFLDSAPLSASDWLAVLRDQGTDWPAFLAVMAERGDSFEALRTQGWNWLLRQSGDTAANRTVWMAAFVGDYLSAQAPSGMLTAEDGPGVPTLVGSSRWTIWTKKGYTNEHGPAVLSSRDTRVASYQLTRARSTDSYMVPIHTFYGTFSFRYFTQFSLATLKGQAGHWIGKIDFGEVERSGARNADATFNIKAEVTEVRARGTPEAPIAVATVKVSHRFEGLFHDETGAQHFRVDAVTGGQRL